MERPGALSRLLRHGRTPPALLTLVLAALYLPMIDGAFTDGDYPEPLAAGAAALAGDLEPLTRYVTETGNTNLRVIPPLVWGIDHRVWGLEPAGYFLTNAAIGILTALLLFVVVRRLTGSVAAALLCGGLMGLDPLLNQALTWVAVRADSMATLSVVAGLALWPWARTRWSGSLLLALLYLVGCFSKITAAPLPLILVAHDLCFGAHHGPGRTAAPPRRAARLLAWARAYGPIGVAAVGYAWVFTAVVGLSGARGIAPGMGHTVGTGLVQLALALGTAVFTPYATRPDEGLLLWDILRVASLVALAIAAARSRSVHGRLAMFGVAFALLSLIVPGPYLLSTELRVFDNGRYLYQPAIGLWLVIAALATAPTARHRAAQAVRGATAAVLGVAVVAFAVEVSPRLGEQRSGSGALLAALGPALASCSAGGRLVVARTRPDPAVEAGLRLAGSPHVLGARHGRAVWFPAGGAQLFDSGTQWGARPQVFPPGLALDTDLRPGSDVLLVETARPLTDGGAAPAFQVVALPLPAMVGGAPSLTWTPLMAASGWRTSHPAGPDGPARRVSPTAEGLAHHELHEFEVTASMPVALGDFAPVLLGPPVALNPRAYCALDVALELAGGGSKRHGDAGHGGRFGLFLWSEREDLEPPLQHTMWFVLPGEHRLHRVRLDLRNAPGWRMAEVVRRFGLIPTSDGDAPVSVHEVALRPCAGAASPSRARPAPAAPPRAAE